MNGKIHIFTAVSLVLLYLAAKKCRELTGEEGPHVSRHEKMKDVDCFDMRYGTAICVTKPAIKAYYFYTHFTHLQKPKEDPSLVAKTNIGPLVSSALDYLQMLYLRIPRKEVVISTAGSLVGGYTGGSYGGKLVVNGDVHVEKSRIHKFGFVSGSIVGSWLGERFGMMLYDVSHGYPYLIEHYRPKRNDTMGATRQEL